MLTFSRRKTNNKSTIKRLYKTEGEKCSDIKTQESRVRMLGANNVKVVTYHRLSE